MKIDYLLEEYLEEDIIGKIYRNEFNGIEEIPLTKEYQGIMNEMKKKEKNLIKLEDFKKYLEIRNVKDSIEAEEQFKLGFKTAIKIILESCHL